MVKKTKKNKEETKENKKKVITVYVVLRFLVLITLIRQIILGNWHSVFICVLTLILFMVPSIIEKSMKIKLPDTLEALIFLFIFSAEILGEIHNFYGNIPYWDSLLHVINGFVAAAVGFSLIDILNDHERFHIHLTPIFVALVAFCFSMTIGILWEFFEYSVDNILTKDMQKDTVVQKIATVKLHPEGKNIPVVIDNIEYTEIYARNSDGELEKTVIEGGYLDIGLIDTMKDLIVNFIGATVFSIFGLLYIKNRDKYKFAEQFLPVIDNDLQENSE